MPDEALEGRGLRRVLGAELSPQTVWQFGSREKRREYLGLSHFPAAKRAAIAAGYLAASAGSRLLTGSAISEEIARPQSVVVEAPAEINDLP